MSEARITFTLHHLVDAIDDAADGILRERYGTTMSQFMLLAVLSTLDKPDITQLAGCLGVSKAAVSKRLPSFVDAGWVATSSDPAHARRVVLSLTEAGAALVLDAGDALDAEFTDLFAAIPSVDVRALHRDLQTVLTALLEKESR